VCTLIQVQLNIILIYCEQDMRYQNITTMKENLNKLNVYYRKKHCRTCLIFRKITTAPTALLLSRPRHIIIIITILVDKKNLVGNFCRTIRCYLTQYYYC